MSDLVLRMTDVYRVHGSGPTAVRALDGVSLSVQAGPSGSPFPTPGARYTAPSPRRRR